MNTAKFTSEDASALLEKIVKGLTIHHNEFQVETKPIGDGVGFTVKFRTHKADAGKVIGKEGKNIKAIKAVFAAIGQRENALIHVMMDEPVEGVPDQLGIARDGWGEFDSAKLLMEMLEVMSEFPFDIMEDKSARFTNYIVSFDVPDTVPKDARIALGTIFCAIGKSHGQKCDVVTN